MLTKGTTVNFATHNDDILNTRFKNVKVIGELDYKDAALHMDIDSRHAGMWPFIPASAYKDDPTSYGYYRVEFASGERTVVGEAWINKDTIVVVSNIVKKATLTFTNATEQQRFESVMAANNLVYKYD